MIVDTSAVLSVLFHEGDILYYVQAIAMSDICRMSSANLLEARMGLIR